MKGQRAAWIVALAVVGLSGCALFNPTPRGNCDGQSGSTATITINMTPLGPYSVSPKECPVMGGRPVKWTTTSNPPANFKVRFTGATPDPGGKKEFEGRRPPNSTGPYTVQIPRLVRHKPGGNNTYDYVVVVDGVEIDPSLIIYPN